MICSKIYKICVIDLFDYKVYCTNMVIFFHFHFQTKGTIICFYCLIPAIIVIKKVMTSYFTFISIYLCRGCPYLSTYLSIYIYIYICHNLFMKGCSNLFIYLLQSIYIPLSMSLSLCPSLSLSMYIYHLFYLYIYIYIYIYIFSLSLYVCLLVSTHSFVPYFITLDVFYINGSANPLEY